MTDLCEFDYSTWSLRCLQKKPCGAQVFKFKLSFEDDKHCNGLPKSAEGNSSKKDMYHGNCSGDGVHLSFCCACHHLFIVNTRTVNT